MEISNNLLCLYSDTIQADDDTFYIQVPKQEVDIGGITAGETYQIALLPTDTDGRGDEVMDQETGASEQRDPPVEVGETREVEIEGIGDKGDGIARVERGYVLIVPETEVGDRVTVHIKETKANVGFTDVVEHHHTPDHA